MPKMKPTPLQPYWDGLGGIAQLYLGNATRVLARLPAQSVHNVITSPPYWALRDYGVEGQLGSEPTPELYVEGMVDVFREVRRVLRDDGTLWLNLGDTYVNGNLIGIPWRVALALQADGWVLRQDIIWHKPSPMPEAVQNRCTKAHEYVFLLSKQKGYYYDNEPIREPLKGTPEQYTRMLANKQRAANAQKGSSVEVGAGSKTGGFNSHISQGKAEVYIPNGTNKRSVWTVPGEPFGGAHFATFPQKLVEPCLLAGCPERCCSHCGAPQYRQVEKSKLTRERPNDQVKRTGQAGTGNSCANTVAGVSTRTTGWEPSCECGAPVCGGVVLDPFVGSGTTTIVALKYGRRSIGIDLSESYLRDIALPRIEGECLKVPSLARVLAAGKPMKPLTFGASRS